ncbi:YkgJ family cysteine cluster protein [Candidatus Woesearchaeota archaeon]|nr:YkgJ family cysteine cluster protein [Candidatus Woesearchaeota archaeon]
MLMKNDFRCNRYCGQCCKKLVVRVSKADIERIRKLGCDEKDFLERDLLYRNKFILKKNEKGCIFLKRHKDGKYSCTIYKHRPKTCVHYPFFSKNRAVKGCMPKDMFPSAFLSGSSKKIY